MRANTETLPWHIQYNSFAGVLPRIRGITLTLVGEKVEFVVNGLRCSPTTTQREPRAGTFTLTETGAVSGFEPNSEFQIQLSEGFCAFGGRLFAAGPAASIDTGTTGVAITVRLVR
jgi:hypothetical protein